MKARTKRAVFAGNPTMMDRVLAFFRPEALPSQHGTYELESGEVKRRSAIHFQRIEEARGYLDLLMSAFGELRRVHISSQNTKKVMKALEEILSLIDMAKKKKYRVDDLKDPLLSRLDDQLRVVALGRYDTVAELLSMMKNNQSIHAEHFALKTPSKNETAQNLINQMQARLDQLARTTP